MPAGCACLPLPRPAFRVRSLSCAGPAPADARRARAVISGRFELHPARNMEPSERRVSGSSAGTERPQLVVSGFGYLDVSALVRPLPCRVVRGESDERNPGCAGADRGDGDGPGLGRGRLLTTRRLRRPGTSRARYRCGAGRPLRGLPAMSLLILRTRLAGVPGDAVGAAPGGVGGARRPRFPGSPCFSAPPRSRASPRPCGPKASADQVVGCGRFPGRARPRGPGGRGDVLGRGDRG